MSDAVQLRVRMYRPGLGDCFLITYTFPGEPQRDSFHMLIDCGVDWNTTGGSEEIRKVAKNIREATGDTLDLLVVTHEHWDHVSGFWRAKNEFEEMQVLRVWLAWTEDPNDEFAKSLKTEQSLALDAVAFGCQQMVRNGLTNEKQRLRLADLGDETANVLSFFGSDVTDALGFSKTSDKAMDFVSSLKTDDHYLSPGDAPLTIEESLPGVRFYVLGPPKDEAQLKRMNPSSVVPETYEFGSSFGERRSLYAGLQALATRENADDPPVLLSKLETERLRDYPFSANRRIEQDKRNARELFADTYFDEEEGWRRIDGDWLTPLSDLALQVDNAVNNTSLVLAIELIGSGRVLLFAADAQIGNWLSWNDHTWTVQDDAGAEHVVTTEELLSRTVLYKVGHHGSHNATLRQKGLEKMTSSQLTAMLPVDQEFAHDRKNWHMPHEPLYEALVEKTNGRILRVDRSWPTPGSPKPDDWTDEAWQAFLGAVAVDDLFIDLVL